MTQLFETLNEAKIGIICLTPKNHEKPWILFEAGAISSKFDESRVLTLLLDGLEVSNLKPPLGLFQATYPDEEGMKSLLWRINALLAFPLEREIFDQVFQTYWPQFETEYKAILSDVIEDGPVIERQEGEKLDEILKAVRGFDKRVRIIEDQKPTRNYNGSVIEALKVQEFLQTLSNKNFTAESTDLVSKVIKQLEYDQLTDNSLRGNRFISHAHAFLDSLGLDRQVKDEVFKHILKHFDKYYPQSPSS